MADSTIGEQVRKTLMGKIMSGELAPGARLKELHLAKELNTSQGLVREALRQLEALGLVVTEPYKGSRVRAVTQEDIQEAYVVRAALENLAGNLAAPHFKGKTAQLSKLAAAIREAARQKHVGKYVQSDIAFHRAIVEAAGNKVLLRSWEALGFEVRIQIRLANTSLNLLEVQEEHWPIVEALGKGAGKNAGKLLRAHIERFAAWPDAA